MSIRKMTEVVPAIIPKSFNDLKEKIAEVQTSVKNVQIDIMDGKFAPEPSWPFSVDESGIVNELETNLSKELRMGFELDMMVYNPEKYIDAWCKFGVSTFLIHFDSTDRLDEVIDLIRENGKGVAIAIKPSISIDELDPFIQKIDAVQFMGNDKIGYHGVELDKKVLQSIKDLRNRHRKLIISIDIGVNFDTSPLLVEAGVSKLVSGSAIYSSFDRGDAIRKLSLS